MSKIPEWHIVDVDNGRVLEVHRSARKAQRAQKRWHQLCIYHDGPETTIHRVVGES